MFIGSQGGERKNWTWENNLPARAAIVRRVFSVLIFCGYMGLSLAMSVGIGCALMDAGKAVGVIAPTTISTTTTTIPSTFSDDVDVLKFVWRGPIGAKAKITCTIANVRRDGGNLRYTKGARNWKLNGTCDSYACLFVSRDGGATYLGGKFDWSRPGESLRPLNHMAQNGYLDNRYPNEPAILPPVPGETWVYVEISLDGAERTEARKFSW
jgi:hypothetical protein